MAAKYTIGPVIKLDGEKEFREAIANSNTVLRTLESELQLTKSAFDKNDKSTENLTSQNKILVKQIEEQKKKLAEMNAVLEMSTKKYGETHETTQKWQRTLNATTANINELERELKANIKTIDDTEKGFNEAEKEVKGFGKSLETAADKSIKLGDIVKAHLISEAIIGGFRRLGSAVKETVEDSIEIASNLSEVQNVVDVTFGQNADVINRWSQSLAKSHGVAELSAKQYAGTLGAMIKSMGLGETQAMSMSQTMVELAADMASFYNLPIEEAFTKIRSGLSGETEPLKQLGINLSVANVEAFALANGVEKAYSAMTQDEQVVQRYNYLMKATADAQGDFARTSESYANQQKILQLEVQNFQANLGDKLLPKMTDSIGKLNNVITESGDEAANSLSNLVGVGINGGIWLLENYKPILTGIGAITGGMLAFKVGGTISVGLTALIASWEAYKAKVAGATVAQWLFNAAANANPYVLLGTAIGAVAVGLGTYALVSSQSEDETSKTNEAIKEQTEALKNLNKEIDQNIQSREEKYTQIEAESVQAQKLADRLFDLSDSTEQSNGKSAEMKALVAEINNLLPELNLKIDEQTGSLNYQREALEKNISVQKEYYKIKAAENNLTQIAKEQVEAEVLIYNTIKALEELQKKRDEIGDNRWVDGKLVKSGDIYELDKQIEKTKENISTAENKLSDLGKQWDTTAKFISDNPLKTEVETSYNTLTDAVMAYAQKQLDGIKDVTTADDERLKQALENIKAEYGTYQATQKTKIDLAKEEATNKKSALSEMLTAAKTAATAEGEAFEKVSGEILKNAESVHSKRMEMYAKEYNTQIGFINGELSEKVNAYQSEIDEIKALTDEENRIAKEKADADKLYQLELKKSSVTSYEEYWAAEKALQDEIERQRKEKEQSERSGQIKTLEQKIDDAKTTATTEKNSLLETLQTRISEEQKLIDKNTEYNMLQIQKEREAKEKAEQAKYDAAKKHIDEIETYLNNSSEKYQTKLKEDTKSFSKYLGENYETFKIQIANYEMALARSNAGLGLDVTNNMTTDIDYDKLGAAITKSFKSLNIQVQMDSQKVGKMLVGKVAQEMYSQ